MAQITKLSVIGTPGAALVIVPTNTVAQPSSIIINWVSGDPTVSVAALSFVVAQPVPLVADWVSGDPQATVSELTFIVAEPTPLVTDWVSGDPTVSVVELSFVVAQPVPIITDWVSGDPLATVIEISPIVINLLSGVLESQVSVSSAALVGHVESGRTISTALVGHVESSRIVRAVRVGHVESGLGVKVVQVGNVLSDDGVATSKTGVISLLKGVRSFAQIGSIEGQERITKAHISFVESQFSVSSAVLTGSVEALQGALRQVVGNAEALQGIRQQVVGSVRAPSFVVARRFGVTEAQQFVRSLIGSGTLELRSQVFPLSAALVALRAGVKLQLTNFVQGDTRAMLLALVREIETKGPIDITGNAIRLRYAISKFEREGAVVERTMAIVDGEDGIAVYKFIGDELVPGIMRGSITITDIEGNAITQPKEFSKEVRSLL